MMQPSITDWLMVVITIIYVIATCIICVFNYRTAKSTQKQIEESRSRYEDEKDYRVLPWFHIAIEDFKKMESELGQIDPVSPYYYSGPDAILLPKYCLRFQIKNIGQGTATKYEYDWECREGLSSFPHLNINKAMMPGEQYEDSIVVEFSVSPKEKRVKLANADLIFTFYDIYNREYKQVERLVFAIMSNEQFVNVDVEAGYPVLMERLKKT